MKKKLLLFLTFMVTTLMVQAGDIYVATNGNDANDGTKARPLQTVHQALRQAREWRRLAARGKVDALMQVKDGITIIVGAGRYYMTEPLLIRPEDSGTEESPTVIKGDSVGRAVLCGDAWAAHRQVYPATGMATLKGFDPKARTITIPAAAVQDVMGKPFTTAEEQLEMVVHQRWAIAILRVKDITVNGDQAVVTFMEPESRLEFEHPWPQPIIVEKPTPSERSSSFLLRWTERREGIEQLLKVEGYENASVKYVSIMNIDFEDACWNRPQHYGHVPLQGGFPLIDAYKLPVPGLPWDSDLENQAWIERPVAAVSVNRAEYIQVTGCTFRRLASTALDFGIGIRYCEIAGNTFEDIGGTAILAGSFAESPREVHQPHTDLAQLCYGLNIVGNHINRATIEDWGAVGIGCGYVKETTIDNNIVENVNYNGISVGWGWTAQYTGMESNNITSNTVRDFALQLYDAGGIYTLSNQPSSRIANNTITRLGRAPYATNDRGFYIYLDAKTDGYQIDQNRCDKVKFGDNHPGPHIVWGKNGPDVEPEYKTQ